MPIEDFLLCPNQLLLDVRSPSEFLQGHIPGAHSLPLFSDEERAQVGTLYKKEGKNAAVKLGLHLVGPKLSSFVEKAENLAGSSKTFGLYCFRGGMRSSSLAWLLETAGFRCTLLSGGYKAFRRWTLEQFKKKYNLIVLGGLTGSGKTDLLQQLNQQGEQVIDLERIASHRGSSFGHLGCAEQPTSEHFENILAYQLSQFNSQQPIWIEDESRMIGKCRIPQDLWQQMGQGSCLWIKSAREDRVKRLLRHYGDHLPQDIIEATQKLMKKLGAVRTKRIIQLIQNRENEMAISAILEYYDQAYAYSCQRLQRERVEIHYSDNDQEVMDQLKKYSISPF